MTCPIDRLRGRIPTLCRLHTSRGCPLGADGAIEGVERELAYGGLAGETAVLVRFVAVGGLDVEGLRQALANAQADLVSRSGYDESSTLYLELIVWAVADGFPPDVIVEAIVLGDLTDSTVAAIEARNREIREEEREDLDDRCFMRMAMNSWQGYGSDALAERCAARFAPIEEPSTPNPTAGSSDDAGDDGSRLAVDPSALDSETIPDGFYQGTLLQTREHLVPDGTAEFTVADGLIEASVGFNVDGRVRSWNGEPVCWIWVIYEFAGSGPVNNPVVLTLEPKVEEVVELKGEDCGANEGWSSTAEQDMRSSFGELLYFHEVTYTNGRIEGTFTGAVWGMDLKVIAG